MQKLKKLDQNRKRKLFTGIVLVLAAAYVFSLRQAKEYRDEQMRVANPNLQIGTVVVRQHDVRLRQQSTSDWNQIERRDRVSLGDSIYSSDKSHATVNLRQGGALEVGENSLVHFQQIENEKLPRLVCGNFVLHVDDVLRVKIGGEITTLEGNGGEVQVVLNVNQKPQFQTLRGKVTVRNKADSALVPPPDAEDVTLCTNDSEYEYAWHLYDLYELREMTLAERSPKPTTIPANFPSRWKTKDSNARVQVSTNPQFSTLFEFPANGTSVNMPKLNVGENYWRVSSGLNQWSAPQKITVRPKYLKEATPQLENPEIQVPLYQQVTTIEMKLKTATPKIGFVAEASYSDKFDPNYTKIFWSQNENVRLSFYKAGVYYYRFRAVSPNQELSDWSDTQKIIAFTPSLASKKVPRKSRTQIARLEPKTDLRRPTSTETTAVLPKDTTSTRMKYEDDLTPIRRNEKYGHERISLQGFIWTLQSSQQYQQATTNPVAGGAGLNYMGWWNQHGLEASLKSGIMGLNQTGKQLALRDFESRYHYRFITGFPFGLMRELQTSLFLGYEMYRNSGDSFSNQYDLIKFGTSLEFPLAFNWATGGEFVYGQGTDKSNKKEISGHISYFFNHDWSFGAGYRLHLFEAGGTKSAPGGVLPYREGYTEGYSILNYHF